MEQVTVPIMSKLQLPVILFECPKTASFKKDEVLTFKLWADPQNEASPIYELTILIG